MSPYPHQHNDKDVLKHNLKDQIPDILWTAVAISTSFAVLYGASSIPPLTATASPTRADLVLSAGLFVTLAVVSVYLLP